jgi:hypothetical protein
LTEKPKAFTKKKNRDQRQNDNRNHRIAAKKRFDSVFRRQAAAAPSRIASSDERGDGRENFHILRMRMAPAGGKSITVTFL